MHSIFNPEREQWVDSIETECLNGPGSGWLRVHVNDERITAQQIIDFLKSKSKNHHIAVETQDPEKRTRARFGK
jgi:ferritin